ncbi:Phosphorylase b kinase gamma catalytic chain, liver/testis isoform [Dirofilaria immitis]|nr:Phosphorylase b kinase gamma catalytic chain, liver/testis isoform [Dirofilaria immitis]
MMFDHLDLDDELDTGDETDQSEALETSTSEFYSAFEVKDVLGHGLASTVRLCIEKGTGLEFAVKIVDISTERQSEVEARRLYNETISEVNLLRQLSEHPSIISIHDFYETPAFLFAVFEMAPKGELFDVLNKSVTLENILCIDEERIVISDFGFATQLQPGEKLKELLGTPGYLAPEMLKCQMYEDANGYGVEVDNWALGTCWLRTFYHRRQLMMLRMIQEAKYEFRADQWSQITSDAKDLISHLLVVDVQRRLTAAECLHHPWMKTAVVILKIRHESEAAVFEVYGHWVNRGFYYSRDMLFANKPRPKCRKMEVEVY